MKIAPLLYAAFTELQEAAMGLLSTYYPQTALKIMKKELEFHGYSE